MQHRIVKCLIGLAAGALVFCFLVVSARAGFNSIYIFGDTVSSTTNNTAPYPSPTNFFGQRFSNGRVWVEVLAHRQGLTNDSVTDPHWAYSSNNCSYFYHTSGDLVRNVGNFSPPANATNALFVVWVNDADFVDDVLNDGTNITLWTNAMNLSLTNHFIAITNLYAKNARTLVMPNAVDITRVPDYSNYGSNNLAFIRRRIIDFNVAFSTTLLGRIKSNCPGMTIYVPDFFALLDNIWTNAAAYGLTNAGTYALNLNGPHKLTNLSMTGPGTNYIWWDDEDPTAKVHEIMADVAQQLLSPARISQITPLKGSNRLDLANGPVGVNGLVESRTNLAAGNWTASVNFNAASPTQAVFVPVSGSQQFYRLNFPFSWTWP
jgi:phospholipase/lecithinase/hemolysin